MRVVIPHHLWWLTVRGLLLVLAAPLGLAAQGNPDPTSFKFLTGQGVVPIFEGWSRNPDGTFEMHFGYINRNYVETIFLPVGADNRVILGTSPDHGQPTVFHTRIQRQVFSVTVPADFAKRELIWSLTVGGVTERAVAWLQMEWEIDPIYRGRFKTPEMIANKPPTLTLEVSKAAVLFPNPLSLAATVVDDGLPRPRPPQSRAVGQETPPTLKPRPDQPEIPVNVPAMPSSSRTRSGNQEPQGLTLAWIAYRGPADVKFDPPTISVKDQKTVVAATFSKPGTYVLRATANDGDLNVRKDVTVSVTGSPRH